jgi:phytepsin
MQAIITEINEKIGAAGVVSQECKTVVSQYGQQILDLLLAEVCMFQTMLLFWLLVWSIAFGGNSTCYLVILQTQPAKICSQVGLCTFDGTHGVR